jgi:hypothetical protein
VHFELLTQSRPFAVAAIDSQVLFHIEACGDITDSNDDDEHDTKVAKSNSTAVALKLAREIRASGMRCGVVLSPATFVNAILPLLR